MTPQDFISKWGAPGGIPGPAYMLNEEQGAQSHFSDLCELLGVPKPGTADGYLFEEKGAVIGGKTGYADVFKRGVFAWEAKAPGKNLDTALKQLLTYSLALSNPPILVVSDRLTIRIHTQFTGHPSQTHSVSLYELDQPDKLALLRRIWTAPESFKPTQTTRDITEAAAKSFATLAEGLRRRGGNSAGACTDTEVANRVAHFLTQCLFCFFAEDVGLLPVRMFERLVNNRHITPAKLTQGLTDLFTAMRDGGMFGADDIPWFNGGLFKRIDVPELGILDVTELRNAAGLNWSAIDVSIFGTLFERGLDPAKRSQLGAHYTDTATIDRIIDPVLRRPLLQKWELLAQQMHELMAKSNQKRRAAYSAGGRSFKASAGDAAFQKAEKLFFGWLDELQNYRILDPACGSGNFLFLGLKALKDIEHQSHLDAAALGLDREADLVTGPHNVLGIELNGYAAELARVTVWIGELQWRMAHGYEFKTNPVLEPLDHIECRDALLSFSAFLPLPLGEGRGEGGMRLEPGARAAQMPQPHTRCFLKSAATSAPPTPLSDVGAQAAEKPEAPAEMGSDPNFAKQNLGSDPISAGLAISIASNQVTEAPWPKANIVIGNPPFLGGSKKRRELGDAYFEALDTVFSGRVPGGADLVCYWFDKSRLAMERDGLEAAGLVSTNSIRGGSNRKVLDAITKSTRIFDAWSDESWVNEGAAVRVSLVCFGRANGSRLDGLGVDQVHADLTAGSEQGASLDLTAAKTLQVNKAACFIGGMKKGPFDVSGQVARNWLRSPNPNGKSNALVVKPWLNGLDVTRRPLDQWIVDFGIDMKEEDAALYEEPFAHVVRVVRPQRDAVRNELEKSRWWLHARPAPDLRRAISSLTRAMATARVAKYRLFVWLQPGVVVDGQLAVTARADDTTFGILHSRFHELWSLRMGTSLEDRPRYTPTTCFETFPFPAGLTPADTAHQRVEVLPCGAIIPADLDKQNVPLAPIDKGQEATNTLLTSANQTIQPTGAEAGVVRMSGAISKSNAYEPPASEPAPPVQREHASPHPNPPPAGEGTKPPARPRQIANQPGQAGQGQSLRDYAIAIAQAAKKLNDLREAWLNPPEWTHKVREVTPLGMDHSPYPDRIEPKPGISEADLKALQKRTLTNLYNVRPAWLTMAHQQLDTAVAAAYCWPDYSPAMPDDEILKRLLTLNLARSVTISGQQEPQIP